MLFTTCILTSTLSCMGEKNKDDPILEIVKLEYRHYLKKYNIDFHVAKCLFNWHQNIKKH